MKKIVDYILMTGDDPKTFNPQIHNMVAKDGWQPYGELIFTGSHYLQVLVKYA